MSEVLVRSDGPRMPDWVARMLDRLLEGDPDVCRRHLSN